MPEANDNLKKVTYNSGSNKIKLVGYPNVEFEINNKKEITDFWVENCNKSLPVLLTLFYTWIYENSLQYIRVIGLMKIFMVMDKYYKHFLNSLKMVIMELMKMGIEMTVYFLSIWKIAMFC